MNGADEQMLQSNGTFASIDFEAPTTTLRLDGFSAQAVNFGATSLCVSTAEGQTPLADVVTLADGFNVAGGPGWSVDACIEESAGDCDALNAGSPDECL